MCLHHNVAMLWGRHNNWYHVEIFQDITYIAHSFAAQTVFSHYHVPTQANLPNNGGLLMTNFRYKKVLKMRRYASGLILQRFP